VATTGDTVCGTGANVDRSGSNDWTSPTRITSDDGSNTSFTGAGCDYLVARNFGFTLSDTATILGIICNWQGRSNSGGNITM